LPDDAVCIGDRYQIGSALFEVTQPRVTCYRVGIRMNEPRMPALLTSSGRPGLIEALSPGWRSLFEALLQSQRSGNAGLVPEAAAQPASPGFRPLRVTAIDQESADVLSLTMQSPNGQLLPMAMPGQYVVVRLQSIAGGPPHFRSYSLSDTLSTERYRISPKIEPNGAAGTYLWEHVGWAMLSTSARRAEASFCSRESGRWCCSVRESGRRRFSRCCTRWPRRARHGRSCGYTLLAIGSIIPLPPKFTASCSRSRTAAATLLQQARLARQNGQEF
jgi:hypothetical protein